jgi:molecular chaperone DnaK
MSIAVGIDLGTTNTVVSVVEDGVPRIVPLSTVDGLLPSVVSFLPNDEILVGHEARARRAVDPESTIFSVKRILGRPWGSEFVEEARSKVAFSLVEGPRQSVSVDVRGTTYGLPEISAFVLRRARAEAEKVLGDRVDRAVVTVPANFNDLQRGATKIACQLAGLDVLRILNEPTAAALAYGLALGTEERIAVFDLGGGTFDLTILDLASNVFEVVATAGDSMLGGDDIDRAIALRMASECSKAFRFDPRADTATFSRLLLAAEEVKRMLTREPEARIEIPNLVREPGAPPLTLGFSLSRTQLEQLSQPHLDRTIRVCERALATAQLTTKQIDRVILVGGSTHSPFVAQRVASFFEKEPYVSLDPDRVVALGAALQASSLDRGRSKRAAAAKVGLRPIDPAHMPRASAASVPAIFTAPAAAPSPTPVPPPISSMPGIESFGSIFATPGAAPAPEETQPISSDNSSGRLGSLVDFGDLDLPSAVPLPGLPAGGASPVTPLGLAAAPPPGAMPGTGSRIPTLSGLPAMTAETIARLQGGDERLRVEGRLPLLVDVTPLGLAIETAGGYAQFLVSANTPVPCDRTMRFATAADNQTSVVVRVAQGDASRFEGNALLGEVTLDGLRAASRGLVQIDVTFAIDVSGILHVSAKDVETGLETSAQIRLLGTRDDAADLEQMAKRQERLAGARTP